MLHLLVALIVLCQSVPIAANSGEATFYGGNVAGGMCSFTTYTIPEGIYGTAMSDSNWDDAAICGACVEVTGPRGNTITAMVVDQCPGCGENHLDLFPDAFAALEDPNVGVIDVDWTVVPCAVDGPLSLKNKEGTSAFWFSLQVFNTENPVDTLEVSADDGATWMGTTRQPYNYFEIPGGTGSESVAVRIHASTGDELVVPDVPCAGGEEMPAQANV